MINKKRLSIIMPVHNMAQYIEKTLDSFIKYISDSDELIIINDGSTDNTFARYKLF